MKSLIPLKNVPLSNDWMFGEVMSDPDICKAVLEEIIHISIDRIEYIQRQDDMSDSYVGHGIRLDVYAADDKGTVYDVEMQTANQYDLERRARYYQSGIDRDLIKRGGVYRDLPNSYVIFLCTFDYFGRGLPVYERTSHISPYCQEVYDNGTHVVMLNTHYDKNNSLIKKAASPALLELLDIVETQSELRPERYSSRLVKSVAAKMENIRNDAGKEEVYMTFQRYLEETAMYAREREHYTLTALYVKRLADHNNISLDEAMDILGVKPAERDWVLRVINSDPQPE